MSRRDVPNIEAEGEGEGAHPSCQLFLTKFAGRARHDVDGTLLPRFSSVVPLRNWQINIAAWLNSR